MNSVITKQNLDIEELKKNIAQMHEGHFKDINKVMSSSRLRRSVRNFSEPSIKDIPRTESNVEMQMQ